MSSTPPSTSSPELLRGVAGESLRVVSAHSRHFLALSLFFLLPFSSLLFLLLSPSFYPNPNPNSNPPQSLLLLLSSSPHFLPSSFLLPFFFILLSILLFLSAASSVSGSVRRGFFGRPVRLLPAISSLPSSLPRLLLTLLLLSLPLLLLSSPILLSFMFFPSPFLVGPISFLSALVFLYLALSFSLALPISALEPLSGLRPLRRSADLIRSMRPVAVSLHLFFVIALGLVIWGCGFREIRMSPDWHEEVPVIARTVVGLAAMTVLLLYWMVSAVVMYFYCRAVHGELAEEIAEEFAWEYVFLPFDEEKVPHVVSVVHQ